MNEPEPQRNPADQSETIGKLAAASAKAQGAMCAARKDSKNPFYGAGYANLASIREAIREPLAVNELAIFQTTRNTPDGNVQVITTLAHSSGEWIRGTLTIRPVKQDPQGVGSALTYARRYSLAAIVGVAPDDDDDGEAAMGRTQSTQNSKRPQAQQRPPQQQPRPLQPPQGATQGQQQPSPPQNNETSPAMSEAQKKCIFGICKKLNQDAHRAASTILQKEVTSLNQLNKKEASQIIDSLNHWNNQSR